MQALQVFKNENFGEIRTVEIENETWFVGKDIAEILGYANPSVAVTKKVDSDDKRFSKMETPQGMQEMSIINESGMYSLIMGSKLTSAKQFKRWVTSEVLPSIRKKGVYMTQQTAIDFMNDPRKMAEILTEFADTKDRLGIAKQKIELDAPKVLFADSVASSKTTILVGELAKIIKQNGVDIGQGRLFAWLRNNGYLIKRKGTDYNSPTQKAMDLGLFEIKETSYTQPNGSVRISKTTKVTGKGQIYFIKKMLSKTA